MIALFAVLLKLAVGLFLASKGVLVALAGVFAGAFGTRIAGERADEDIDGTGEIDVAAGEGDTPGGTGPAPASGRRRRRWRFT